MHTLHTKKIHTCLLDRHLIKSYQKVLNRVRNYVPCIKLAVFCNTKMESFHARARRCIFTTWGDYYESFEPKTFNFKVGPSNDEWKKVLCLENQTLFWYSLGLYGNMIPNFQILEMWKFCQSLKICIELASHFIFGDLVAVHFAICIGDSTSKHIINVQDRPPIPKWWTLTVNDVFNHLKVVTPCTKSIKNDQNWKVSSLSPNTEGQNVCKKCKKEKLCKVSLLYFCTTL